MTFAPMEQFHPFDLLDDGINRGDCMEILHEMPGGIFKMIFIDPPYNQGVDYGRGRKGDLQEVDQYLKGLTWLVELCLPKLTHDGSLWFLIGEKHADQIGIILSHHLPRRSRIIWHETFGQYHEHAFPSNHRHLFWHVVDRKKSPFYKDDIRVPSKRMQMGDKRAAGPRIPGDVWTIPRLCGNAKERIAGHPCQLPMALVERAMLSCTQPGDFVLDPMAGTGTTLHVAKYHRRRYFGIERNEAYVDSARGRLERVEPRGQEGPGPV